MTSETDASGRFILRDHALVAFRFTGVHDTDLALFDRHNILFALIISAPIHPPTFRVTLDSAMNKDGAFTATAGEVVSVTPHEPKAKNQ